MPIEKKEMLFGFATGAVIAMVFIGLISWNPGFVLLFVLPLQVCVGAIFLIAAPNLPYHMAAPTSCAIGVISTFFVTVCLWVLLIMFRAS